MPADPLASEATVPSGRTSMEICLGRLRANAGRIAVAAGSRSVIAVLKGDAYGHGAVRCGRALVGERIAALATGSLEDALAMRSAGIHLPIVMLCNLAPESLSVAVGHQLIPSITSPQAAEVVNAVSGSERIPVYVKVDAGFGRFGIPLEAACSFIQWVAGLQGLRLAGAYTHLPFSDAVGRDWARRRLGDFGSLLGTLVASGVVIPSTQAISSPGLEAGLADPCNTVACGSLLYGLRSIDAALPSQVKSEPVATAIRTRLAGVASGIAKQPPAIRAPYLRSVSSTTGTVPIGLAHGFRQPRSDAGACMLLRGQRVPILRVCLDNTILDLSGIRGPKEGEQVMALGRDGTASIGISELADWLGMSPMVALLSMGGRLNRQYSS